MKFVEAVASTLWKTTASAAVFSVVTLLLALSYFLRKTIANDRLLRQAETQNLQLTEQLHEAQRQLMNTEKLAVMEECGIRTTRNPAEMGKLLKSVLK